MLNKFELDFLIIINGPLESHTEHFRAPGGALLLLLLLIVSEFFRQLHKLVELFVLSAVSSLMAGVIASGLILGCFFLSAANNIRSKWLLLLDKRLLGDAKPNRPAKRLLEGSMALDIDLLSSHSILLLANRLALIDDEPASFEFPGFAPPDFCCCCCCC